MGAIARALPSLRSRSGARGAVRGRRLRRLAAIALLLGAVVLAGYWFWLRDSELVAVERVEVRGVGDRSDLAVALEAEAMTQTTLNFDREALAAVVTGDPAVRSITVATDFPRGATIDVDLREPVGYLTSGGAVVAGDGVVLEGEGGRRSGLPPIEADASGTPGAALEGEALTLARMLGAAPAPLLETVESASLDPELGLVAVLEPGVELRFGERSRLESKWQAAAAVLADRRLKEVAYIDLSVPERPVAGAPQAAAEPAPAAAVEPAPE